MKARRVLLAAWLTALTVAPTLAAGRPVCCAPKAPAPSAARGCCAAATPVSTAGSKGCCKRPEAPTQEAKSSPRMPAALAVSATILGSSALASIAIPPAAAVSLARREHRAVSPDDSPPDLLLRHHILLI